MPKATHLAGSDVTWIESSFFRNFALTCYTVRATITLPVQKFPLKLRSY